MMDGSIIRFPDGRLAVRHIDRVLLLPLEDRVEIPAEMCVIEIGEWHLLDVHPVVHDRLDRCATSQNLQDNLQTV